MLRKRPSIVMLPALALAIALAGCGGAAQPTAAPTAAPTQAAEATKAPAATVAATSAVTSSTTTSGTAGTTTTVTTTGTTSGTTGTTATLPDLKGRSLKVGSDTTYPPFESIDANKNIVGFDVDLVNAVCQKVNCKAQFFTADFDSLLVAVNNKTYDMSVSGWTITDERAKTVDFSIPYIPNTEVLLVRNDETRIKEPEDLKNPAYVVAVQLGTSNSISAKKLVADPNKNVKEFQDFPGAVQALINKQADAVVIDTFAASSLLEDNKGKIKITGKQFGEEYLGMVFRKGEADLRDAFNAGIKSVVADGTFTKICSQWWKDIDPKPDCTGKGLPWNK